MLREATTSRSLCGDRLGGFVDKDNDDDDDDGADDGAGTVVNDCAKSLLLPNSDNSENHSN